MANGIKKCAVCGRLYEAYGVADVEETEIEGDPMSEDDVINDDTEYVIYEKDEEYPGVDFTVNGMQLLTITTHMDIQASEDPMDLCTTCKGMIFGDNGLIESIKGTANPSLITGVSFTFTTN